MHFLQHNYTKYIFSSEATLEVILSLSIQYIIELVRRFVSQAFVLLSIWQGAMGTLGRLLNSSPKFNKKNFLFVGLTDLGTFINFNWLVH